MWKILAFLFDASRAGAAASARLLPSWNYCGNSFRAVAEDDVDGRPAATAAADRDRLRKSPIAIDLASPNDSWEERWGEKASRRDQQLASFYFCLVWCP